MLLVVMNAVGFLMCAGLLLIENNTVTKCQMIILVMVIGLLMATWVILFEKLFQHWSCFFG